TSPVSCTVSPVSIAEVSVYGWWYHSGRESSASGPVSGYVTGDTESWARAAATLAATDSNEDAAAAHGVSPPSPAVVPEIVPSVPVVMTAPGRNSGTMPSDSWSIAQAS